MSYNKQKCTKKGAKQGNRNVRSGRQNNDVKSKDLVETRSGVERSKDNDVAWYTHSKELLNSSASLSMNNATGSGMSLIGSGVQTGVVGAIPPNATGIDKYNHNLMHVPGICTLRVLPCAGYATDNTSPVNVAAKNIYTWVRHMNSGAKNYNSPDLMLYIIAMTQAYAYYAWMTRLYGVVNLYSQVNRYLPDALIVSMGVDPVDLRKNLPDFHYYINSFANKLGSMCLPDNMPLVWRQMWMFSGIYSDGDNQKSQIYLYTPSQFLKYNATSSTQGGKLEAITMQRGNETPMKYNSIKLIGDSILNAIIADEDMNIMSGDIKKAYGESGLMKVVEIDRNYVVVPKYSPEVLSQMQNASVIPISTLEVGQDVDANCLVNNITWATLSNKPEIYLGGGLNRVFNLYGEDSSPERIMVATRLMTTLSEKVTFGADHVVTGVEYTLTSCGTEIVVEVDTYNWYPETNTLGYALTRTSFGKIGFIDAIHRTKFAYAPIFMMAVQEDAPTEDKYYPQGVIGDLDNWTVLQMNDIKKLHETATLSELAVPQMGMAR